jgi:hypothetical protein
MRLHRVHMSGNEDGTKWSRRVEATGRNMGSSRTVRLFIIQVKSIVCLAGRNAVGIWGGILSTRSLYAARGCESCLRRQDAAAP